MSPRRTVAVARLEFSRQWRRPLFWAFLALIVPVSWAIANGPFAFTGEGAAAHSVAIARGIALGTALVAGWFVAIAAGLAIIGDVGDRVGEILHSTPLLPEEYVWGKFLGVLSIFSLGVAANLIPEMVFFEVLGSSQDGQVLPRIAKHLGDYFETLVVFALPSLFFTAGLSFAIGERTRHKTLVYVVPVALVAWLAIVWTVHPAPRGTPIDTLLTIVDPSGYRWLSENWVAPHMTTSNGDSPMTLDRLLATNRALVAIVGATCVFWCVTSYRRSIGGDVGAPVPTPDVRRSPRR